MFPRGGGTALAPVRGQFNVMAAPYNATGLGVSSDRVAIQNAINDCAALGGGTVFLPTPPVGFLTDGSLIIAGSGVALEGAGSQASIITCAANANFDVVVVASATGNSAHLNTYLVGCAVRHIGIRRNGAATNTACGVKVTYAMYSDVEDVRIYNMGGGFYISAGLNNTVDNVRVTGANNNVAAGTIGFQITNAQGPMDSLRVTRSTCQYDYTQATGATGGTYNSGGTSLGWFLGGGGIQDAFISDCEFDNLSTGLLIQGGAGQFGPGSFDVHFHNFNGGDGGATHIIQNATAATNGAIEFNGGMCSNGLGPQITNSSGVTYSQYQLYNCGTGFTFTNCENCSVDHVMSYGSSTAFAIVDNSQWISIDTNKLKGAGIGVKFVNASANCTVNGNTMNGITANNAMNIAAGCSAIVATGNAWGGATNYTDAGFGNAIANNV